MSVSRNKNFTLMFRKQALSQGPDLPPGNPPTRVYGEFEN